MKQIFLLFSLLIFSILNGQSKKLKVKLYIKDSICQGEGKPYKIIKRKCKNIGVLLSSDLYMSHKKVGKTNTRGVFRIKLTKEELEYYKFLVFVSENIQTSFLYIDNLNKKNFFQVEAEKKASEYYSVAKPAIYLYPEKKENISVQLNFKGKIGTTFPEYHEGWNVIASPNGELLNTKDNRKYNYLFWDGIYNFPKNHFDYKEGFVVKNDELIPFFISKLSQIGFNDTEINDFIVYWLPQLKENEINFIHFWINDNIDNSSFLKVDPKPETEIILYFEFKKVDNSYKANEQLLPKIQRKGFTLVEWGGCNLLGKKIE